MRPGEKIGIVSRDGVSYLTLDNVTYDHAGKYEVAVENPLGKDRRFFSLAVEGKLSVYIVYFCEPLSYTKIYDTRLWTRRYSAQSYFN